MKFGASGSFWQSQWRLPKKLQYHFFKSSEPESSILRWTGLPLFQTLTSTSVALTEDREFRTRNHVRRVKISESNWPSAERFLRKRSLGRPSVLNRSSPTILASIRHIPFFDYAAGLALNEGREVLNSFCRGCSGKIYFSLLNLTGIFGNLDMRIEGTYWSGVLKIIGPASPLPFSRTYHCSPHTRPNVVLLFPSDRGLDFQAWPRASVFWESGIIPWFSFISPCTFNWDQESSALLTPPSLDD